jgi:hypothetical protein
MSDESRGQALRFDAVNQGGVSSASTDLDGNLPGLPKYSSDLG